MGKSIDTLRKNIIVLRQLGIFNNGINSIKISIWMREAKTGYPQVSEDCARSEQTYTAEHYL